MKVIGSMVSLLTVSSSDDTVVDQVKKLAKRNQTAQRKAISRSAWRYTAAKPSIWDTRKSKTMNFTLKHCVGSANANFAEVRIFKKKAETLQHVIGKGLIWAMFREQYPNIHVEADIGDKRLPDVVAFDKSVSFVDEIDNGTSRERVTSSIPLFWGESGRMSPQKAAEIAHKFPDTHFCHLRWGVDIEQCTTELDYALQPILQYRTAPFEFGVLYGDPREYVDEGGNVTICKQDVNWKIF